MASTPDPVGLDLGTTGGEWLFQQGDMLLGPVPARVLVDKLFRGEIDGKTPVSPAGEEHFTPIEQVDFFKLHVKKAAVKLSVERSSQEQAAERKRKVTTKAAAFGVVGVVVLVGGAIGATYLASHKFFRGSDEDLELGIQVEPPQIAFATATEDEVALPVGTTGPTGPTGATGPRHIKRPAAPHGAAGTAPTPGGAPTPSAADPDGMQTVQYDQNAIKAVVDAHTKSLYPCIKAEALANPGKGARIPLEFTVGNDGHVTKLWIDNPDYKSGALYDCMLKTLKSWPFKAYVGEQANVSLNFSFGPKS